jgi:cell wall assembly regulator SMI1
MEAPVEIIQRAMRTTLLDEDGGEIQLELFPPMQDGEIDALETRLPCRLPDGFRDLLKFTRGFEGGAAEAVDFSGELPFAHEEIFPHGFPIAADGFGNFWVADLTPGSSDFGPIFFACHDPPVVAFQSSSVAGFLGDLLFRTPSHDSPIDFVHEEAVLAIWKRNPQAVSRSVALSSDDRDLKDFALRVPEKFLIVDLRRAATGDGFSWGRFGPDTRIYRHGDAPIFAYGPTS